MTVFIFLNSDLLSIPCYREHCGSLRQKGDVVICANGGYEIARLAGVRPDLVIGDLDSLKESSVDQGIEVRRYPSRKDYSDFELALGEAERRGPERIYVYGALGGRIDHELTNILLMVHSSLPLVCIEKGMEIHHVVECLRLHGKRGSLCSLLALKGPCRVTDMKGFRYLLHDEELRPSSRGLSNVITADEASFSVAGGCLIAVVISSHQRRP